VKIASVLRRDGELNWKLDSFGAWFNGHGAQFLKVKDRHWTITTVRQEGGFEFIHAESDGVMIRQLPNIMVLGFKPAAPRWRDDVWTTIVGFLRENVYGQWDKGTEMPQKDYLFYFSPNGFDRRRGTCFDSFVAVVVNDVVWIGFPKRTVSDGRTPFSASLEKNTGWFEEGFSLK